MCGARQVARGLPRRGDTPVSELAHAETVAALLERFLDGLWAEAGASDNTLLAYRTDLLALDRYLHSQGRGLCTATEQDLNAFLGLTSRQSARTAARRLAAIRRFFRYLLRERMIEHDPTLRIVGPRLGRFEANGKANEIRAHSMSLYWLGSMLLFFGWFFFNGVSSLG